MAENLKKIFILIAVAGVLWFPVAVGLPNPDEIGLRWKNGDVLPGQLLESGEGTIRWSSPYFLDPLVLDVEVLDAVEFRKPDAPPVAAERQALPTETFRVHTLSGDVWVADLIGSDNDTFLFSSKRHGQFRVKRSAVYMLERRERPDFLFDGSQLKNWKLPEPKRETVDPALPFDFVRRSDWFADPEGHPKTWIDNAEIFHAFNFPEHFEIELALASDTHPPNFSFAFGKDPYQALRLAIWKDELVAVQGVLFKSVMAIQPEQRSVRLRLTYHEGTGALSVFDATGNFRLKLEGVEPTVKDSGLYIQNRGEDLTVRNLKVYRQLKEPAAQRVNLDKPHVYMTNGEKIQGRLFVQEDAAYVLDTDGKRHDIDLQALNHIVQPGTPSVGLDQTVTLKYPDKVVLHGKLIQVKPGSVRLQTAFANAPITCSLTDALRLQIAAKPYISEAIEDKDKLVLASGNLHGRVVFGGGQGASSIQWESVGALKPVRLVDNRTFHIERNGEPAIVAETRASNPQFPHTLHLKTGEIFPSQIATYDGESVSFRSPFISAQRLDSADIKALEFSGRTHAPNTDRTQPETDFNSLKVTMADKGNGIKEVDVRMVVVGKDGEEVVLNVDNVAEVNNGGPVLVINEMDLVRKPEPDWIEIAPRNGNLNMELPELPVGRFVVMSSSTRLPDLEKDKSHRKLERALTVPRFSRDNPPSHLLVAKTGDMKRGTLLDFQGQTIQFDSKLREFSVPIDRVARVVDVSIFSNQYPVTSGQLKSGSVKPKFSFLETGNWKLETDPPTADSRQPTAIQPVVRTTLTDGSILIFVPLEVEDGKLLGHSSIYGAVSVPVDSIQDLHFGDKATSFTAAFEKWVVRPAKEPSYSDRPPQPPRK